MTKINRIIVVQTPQGLPEPGDFRIEEVELEALGDGQLHVRTLYISVDPYLRGRLSGKHITGKIEPGQAMESQCVGEVLASNHPGIEAGQHVSGFWHWAEEAIVGGNTVTVLDSEQAPLSLSLGILGMPGLTAWAGLRTLGEAKAGQTWVVSAAAGPVGSMVGQLAKIIGCRVVGIAGGPEKCRWLEDAAGFDATIDYKAEDIRAGLARTCPDGVDGYFDNVGGDVLQAVMEQLAVGAYVVLCGLMDQYNEDETPPGPNPGLIILARATVRGLVVYDHEDQRPEFLETCSAWVREGKIAVREDITDGLANAPQAFCRLMAGQTFGKVLVKV